MKKILETDTIKKSKVCYDASPDKYENIVLFPEKLKKANEELAKSNSNDFIKKQGLQPSEMC